MKKFKPPTVKEIEEYAFETGYDVDAEQIHDYYSMNDWRDSKNTPIKNWKMKLRAVWFKPELKSKNFSIPKIVLKHRLNIESVNDAFRDDTVSRDDKNTLYLWWKNRTGKTRIASDGKPMFTYLFTHADSESMKEIEYLKKL